MFYCWFYGCDLSSFPERYLLIEYPLVEREESVLAFATKKLLLRLRQAKRLPSTPTDIEKLLPIKMVRYIPSVTLARMVTIHQEDNSCEAESTRNNRKNDTLKHRNNRNIGSKTPAK